MFTNNGYCQLLMFCCHCLHCVSPFHKNLRSQLLVPSPYLPELSSICGLTYRQLLVCFLRPNMDRGLETFGLDATYIDTLLHRFNARLLLCLWTGDCVVCALAWLFSFFDICDKHGVGQTKHALISEESCERELTTNKSLDMLNVETVSRAIVATRAQAKQETRFIRNFI